MTRNHLAEHYGAKCLDRLMWIRTADWRSELNADLFECWQAAAVRYAVAAAHAANEDTVCPDGPACPDPECRRIRAVRGLPVAPAAGQD